MGTLPEEDQRTFMIVSRSILHYMRKVSYKRSQKAKTNILRSLKLFENRGV